MPQTEVAPEQAALDELQVDATTPEAQATLQEWQTQLNKERANVLGTLGEGATRLAQLGDGSVVTEQEVRSSIDRGEEPSGPYGGGTRQ